MTRYLIDSQILIWTFSRSSELAIPIKNELEDLNNAIYVSYASLTEIATKHRDGKLKFSVPFDIFMNQIQERNGFRLLEIRPFHILMLNRIQPFDGHKDPFDHIIIAQAIAEQMCLISADRHFPHYTNQGLELLQNK